MLDVGRFFVATLGLILLVQLPRYYSAAGFDLPPARASDVQHATSESALAIYCTALVRDNTGPLQARRPLAPIPGATPACPAVAIPPTPSAPSAWTLSSKPTAATPGPPWVWRISPKCCGTIFWSTIRPTPNGPTGTASCCPTATAPC